jgi:ABC-2 type transport system ATP-binding protein
VSHSIEVTDLSKTFGAFQAVKGVSFHVERGEIFGYLGANGAGKSTTIRMLCGLMIPSGGKALVAGHDVATETDSVRMSVGYMSQKFSLYPDLTAFENMDFFGGAYRIPTKLRRARAAQLLAEVGLDPSAPLLAGAMPGGMRQRLALATALVHEPSVVFLDEPTAGVDPGARRNFWRLIRKLADAGTTVFVTTHYMDEAEYCQRVGMMVDGRLVALDTPSGLKRTFVPGLLLDVRGGGLKPAALAGLPGVKVVEPFGAGLHVRGEPGVMTKEAVQHALIAAGGQEVALDEIDPTLEDVFLVIAGRKAA